MIKRSAAIWYCFAVLVVWLSSAISAENTRPSATETFLSPTIAEFSEGNYAAAYRDLLKYRNTFGGNLIVDYMLATSACRSGDDVVSKWGRDYFDKIKSDYGRELSASVKPAEAIYAEAALCITGRFAGKATVLPLNSAQVSNGGGGGGRLNQKCRVPTIRSCEDY